MGFLSLFPKRDMTAIWLDFCGCLKQYELCNIGYNGFPSTAWHAFGTRKNKSEGRLFNYDINPFASGLTRSVVDISRQYFKACNNDPMGKAVYQVECGQIISSAQYIDCPEYLPIERFYHQYGIEFRIVVPLPSPSRHWLPVLAASSGISHQKGQKVLDSEADKLMDKLLKLNHEMMHYYPGYFNPFLGHKVFPEKALQIIKLVSLGFSNKEIAKQVELTEEGVKYHLKNMKKLLKARNVTHLIGIAKDIQLL